MPTLSIDIEAKLASFQDSINNVERSVGGLSNRLQGAFSGLASTIGALAGAAGVSALGSLVKNSIDAADELGKLSQRVGVTVESLSELQYAGQLADVGTDALAEGLKKLSVNLQDAANGNKGLQASFAAVGISIAELGNLNADQAVRRIADAFSRMEDGARKTALATDLGGRSFSQWIPLLNQGSAGLRDAAEEARRFGVVVDSDTAKAAEAFNDNLTRLRATADGFAKDLASRMLPTLERFTNELLAGQRAFGSLGSALIGIGTTNPFKSLAENLKDARSEVERLAARLNAIPQSGQRLREDFAGQLDQAKRRLEYFKELERLNIGGGGGGNADARDLRLNAPRAAGANPADTLNKAVADPDTTERAARRFTQIYLDQFEILSKRGKEYQQALLDQLEEGNRVDAKFVKDQADALDRVLSGTRSGQESAVFRDIETLNNALIQGRINAEQYDEAFLVMQQRLNDIREIGGDTFKELSNDGTQALRDLQFAIEGWGRNFTNTLADAIETGKLNFSDLVRSILRDLVRLQIQQSITRPLFNALSGALGSFNFGFGGSGGASSGGGTGGNFVPYGGGRATGGGVTAGVAYTVGERGPELFIPRANGTVMPNGSGGGITQVFNIAPGVDQGAVYRAAAMGASMAKSDIARAQRIGEMG